MASRAARDLGLQRIGTTTRYLAVGSLVAGGVLSAVVAEAVPGKAGHPVVPLTTTTVDPSQTTPAQTTPGHATPAQRAPAAGNTATTVPSATVPALTAPAQAPQPAFAAPVVSSGGS
jgi:hypothetical protein